jgi:superfamily II DNA or RNA helicase
MTKRLFLALTVFGLFLPGLAFGSSTAIERFLSNLSAENAAVFRPFAENVIYPVVGDKIRYIRVTPKPGVANTFLLQVTVQSRLVAVYDIEFTAKPTTMLGLPEVSILRGPVAVSRLEVTPELSPTMKIVVQGQFRSMVRADGILHPHFPDLDGRILLSGPQLTALRNLLSLRQAQLADTHRTGPVLVGLVMPVAMGKTEVAVRYLAEIDKQTQTSHQIIIIVESTDQLDDMRKRFQSRFQIPNSEILSLYGDGASTSYNLKARLVLATRTTFFNRQSELFAAGLASGPTALLIDEAQHTGLRGGEFDQILAEFDRRLKTTDQIFKMTATFWHESGSQLIQQLRGQVYGAFLNDVEQSQLRAGIDLPELSRRALFRAIASGYLSPLNSYKLVNYLDLESGVSMDDILKRSGLQKAEPGASLERQQQILGREAGIHMPLIKHLAHTIRESFIRGKLAEGATGKASITVFDRGVIFAPSQAHANFYAGLLNLEFGRQIEFRAYHSGSGVSEGTLDWFRDENVHNDRERAIELQKHKYLIVVNKLNEGIDIAKINALYILRNAFVYRNVLQMMGRGERVYPFKPDLRVVDYAGSLEVLFQEFPVDQFPMAFVRRKQTQARDQQSGVTVDGAAVDLTKFSSRERLFLHQLATVVERHEAPLPEPPPAAPPPPPAAPEAPATILSVQARSAPTSFLDQPADPIDWRRLQLGRPPTAPEALVTDPKWIAHFSTYLDDYNDPYSGEAIGSTPEDLATFKTLDSWLSIARAFSLDQEVAGALRRGLNWYFRSSSNLQVLKTKELGTFIFELFRFVPKKSYQDFDIAILKSARSPVFFSDHGTLFQALEVRHDLGLRTMAELYDFTNYLIQTYGLNAENANALTRVVSLRPKLHSGHGVVADWIYLQALLYGASQLKLRQYSLWSGARAKRRVTMITQAWHITNEWFKLRGFIAPNEVAFGDAHGDPVIPLAFSGMSARTLNTLGDHLGATFGQFLRANQTDKELMRTPNFGRVCLTEVHAYFAGIGKFGLEPVDDQEIRTWLTNVALHLIQKEAGSENDDCEKPLRPQYSASEAAAHS